jgi:hypothetical protein
MKYEAKDVVEGTEEVSVREEYIIRCITYNYWFPTKLEDYYVITAKEGITHWYKIDMKQLDPGKDEVRSLVDNYGVARFHSLEDISDWLNGKDVYVTVGSGNYVISVPGINNCRRLPGIRKESIYIERRIITTKKDIVPFVQVKDEAEMKLKPKNYK